MSRLPGPVAAVAAKAGSLPDLHPGAFRAVLVAGGVLLIIDGLCPAIRGALHPAGR